MRIIVDTRENTPWTFPPDIETVPGSLPTGDYTVEGMESHVCLERKTVADLVGCFTTGRARFKKELARMRAYPLAAVVVEGSLQQLADGEYRSRLHPNAALGSLASWQCRFGVPFVFAHTPELAVQYVLALLGSYSKQLVEQLTALGVS